MGVIGPEIERHYSQSRESERLSNEWGELERVRTQAILARYLPSPPAVILDVGGAAGAYAFPLARQGYEVHLVDPVELHIEQARSHATAARVKLASITPGDARSLGFPARSADALLLLGPLYHLVKQSDRAQALSEARRILKPGGVLFAAAISRFASFIDGLTRGFFHDGEFRKIVESDLSSGMHENSTGKLEYFTTAYFHRPEEFSQEIGSAGFERVRTLAIEGPAWSTPGFRAVWNDSEQRSKLLEFLSVMESEPSLQGASAHIIAVAFCPN